MPQSLQGTLTCIIFFGPYKRPPKKKLLNKLCKIHAMEYFVALKAGSV